CVIDDRAEERPRVVQALQPPSRAARTRRPVCLERGSEPVPRRQLDPGLRPGKDPGNGPQVVDRSPDLEARSPGGPRAELETRDLVDGCQPGEEAREARIVVDEGAVGP